MFSVPTKVLHGLHACDSGYLFISLSTTRLRGFGVRGVCVCVMAVYVCPGFGCVLENEDGCAHELDTCHVTQVKPASLVADVNLPRSASPLGG